MNMDDQKLISTEAREGYELRTIEPGSVAETLDDAKRFAVAFAEGVG